LEGQDARKIAERQRRLMDSIQYIIRQARRRNLDPNAVLAVARQEGLGGGVGDQGTSFGPWQLHAGGALPAGIRNPQQWAWSPAGINYALDRIAGVAAGKRGQAAVQAIVTGFERPANPGREIAGASRAYGRAAGAGRPLAGSAFDTSSVGRPQPPRRAAASSPGLDVSGIINLTNSIVGLPPVPIQVNLPGRQTAAPPQRINRTLSSGGRTSGRNPGLSPRRGGRSLNWLEHFAAPFGVQVTSTTAATTSRTRTTTAAARSTSAATRTAWPRCNAKP
jgi:hypothetical protein